MGCIFKGSITSIGDFLPLFNVNGISHCIRHNAVLTEIGCAIIADQELTPIRGLLRFGLCSFFHLRLLDGILIRVGRFHLFLNFSGNGSFIVQGFALCADLIRTLRHVCCMCRQDKRCAQQNR